MSETTPGHIDPFQRLQPQDFEPPNWDALSPDVLGQLTAADGPGIVTDPVTQREFSSAREMIPDTEHGDSGPSGITCFFEPGDESGYGMPDMMRAWPVFRRFQIMYPDLVTSLMEKIAGVEGNAPRELHEDLFAAYRIMRHLVDRRDPYVIRSDDGTADDRLLIR